jgi:hypothetical protein
VRGAPTEYGGLTYSATMREGGMDMTIEWDARADARGLVLHLPPFLDPKVVADGRRIRCMAGAWSLPKTTRTVDVSWTPRPLPDISFRRIVESYLRDHAARAASIGNPESMSSTTARNQETLCRNDGVEG